jgi:hypothetical protein
MCIRSCKITCIRSCKSSHTSRGSVVSTRTYVHANAHVCMHLNVHALVLSFKKNLQLGPDLARAVVAVSGLGIRECQHAGGHRPRALPSVAGLCISPVCLFVCGCACMYACFCRGCSLCTCVMCADALSVAWLFCMCCVASCVSLCVVARFVLRVRIYLLSF